MKIIKHKAETFLGGDKIKATYYQTKEEALGSETASDDLYLKRKYAGAEEIDVYCENCDKELTEDDEYLKVDEHTRYCSDCYEENSFITYTVGDDYVSDENDGEIHKIGEELD